MRNTVRLTVLLIAMLATVQVKASELDLSKIRFKQFDDALSGPSGEFLLPGSNLASGLQCFESNFTVQPVPENVIYRLIIKNNPTETVYSIKFAAFHIVEKRVLKEVTPSNLEMTAKARRKACSGPIVKSEFAGTKVSFDLTVIKKGISGPMPADVAIVMTQESLQSFNQNYRDILVSALAHAAKSSFDIPFSSDNQTDPLVIAEGAMKYAIEAKPTSEDLGVFEIADKL